MKDTSSGNLIGGKFNWEDPFLIEEQLTSKRQVRDTARRTHGRSSCRLKDWNRREYFDRR